MQSNEQLDLNLDAGTPPPIPPLLPVERKSWQKVQKFEFYGTASEYFGIWIVNILLILITLGLYSPWAKVRRLRYFYGNTAFYNRRFDFTGLPKKILIGRLIALTIWIGISVASKLSYSIASIGALLLYLAIPWLIRATLRFKARNSKFGNSRFYFSGENKEIYWVSLKAFLLVVFTMGIFYPVALWMYKRYSLDHLYVGQLKFKLRAAWSAYMGAVYIPLLIFAAIMFVTGIVFALLIGVVGSGGIYFISTVIAILYFILFFFFYPLISARLFMVTWNNTTISRSVFSTNCNQWRYAWIVGSNWIVRILSVGLMTPWCAIRLYRYQVESLQLELRNDPDEMLNRIQTDHSALAEEITDIFDIDVSL